MARIARLVIVGMPHHVTQRSNRGVKVFFTDADRRRHLEFMATYADRHGLRIYAYCLMPDHVHLVGVPEKPNSVSAAFKSMQMEYSSHVRQRRKVRGPMWRKRFASCPLDRRHLWEAIRYVERNPVRAGLVRKAEKYPWSSAAGHAGLREDPLLSGNLENRGVVKNWAKWLREGEDAALVEMIRRSTRTGRPAGSKAFVTRIEKLTGRKLKMGKPGRPRKDARPKKIKARKRRIAKNKARRPAPKRH
jgi:putative transposase